MEQQHTNKSGGEIDEKVQAYITLIRRNKFIKLFKNELSKHNWLYSDGSQPISNGDVGLVLDENNKKHIECVIVSCSNCGDYTIIEIENLI